MDIFAHLIAGQLFATILTGGGDSPTPVDIATDARTTEAGTVAWKNIDLTEWGQGLRADRPGLAKSPSWRPHFP